MNDVIDKLAEIETAAVNIMEQVSLEKATLVKDSEQRIKVFDKDFQRDLDRQIEELKAVNERDVQGVIRQMHQDGIREIERLEEKYEESHKSLADNIVNMLTGV